MVKVLRQSLLSKKICARAIVKNHGDQIKINSHKEYSPFMYKT